jgi:hypothetical protein
MLSSSLHIVAVKLNKNSILSVAYILIQARATKRAVAINCICSFRYEMPVLPYSKHKNKYCGCISIIITEERGLLYNQFCRRQFISYQSKVHVQICKVDGRICTAPGSEGSQQLMSDVMCNVLAVS